MNVLVINGSPRMERGNTQAILTPFLVGIRESGAKIEIVNLAKRNLKPCIGCFTCYAKTPGKCVHDDDMASLEEKISASDLLVLASPVYLDGMTALCKIFVDRLVTFLDPHFSKTERGFYHPLRKRFPSKMFLVSVCGYPGLMNFDPLVAHFRKICLNMSSEYKGALLRPAAFSLLMGKKYPERLREVVDAARTIGRDLVGTNFVDQDTLNKASQDICPEDELIKMANSYWDRELANT